MTRIYLDWNATAPLMPEVREEMTRALERTWGNASSVHHEGQAARSVVERARRAVAASINAPAQGVVLTGGATEANNQVIRHHARTTEDPYLVCTMVEHPSVLEVVTELGRDGVELDLWPVDSEGRLDLQWFRDRAGQTTLLSVMLANNEVGNVYPVTEIARIAREYGVRLHVDATQAYGRIPVDFEALGADYLTLSFHKCGGPKGIGALVVREGLKVEAILAGGHQERGRRPGTENVPALAGLIAAAQTVSKNVAAWNRDLENKRAAFLEQLAECVDFELRGDHEARLPNTINLAFPEVDGEDALLALDLEGVSASSGSACTAGSLEPSRVLIAMGFDRTDAKRSVRLSFGPATTGRELAEAAARIGRVVSRLRN